MSICDTASRMMPYNSAKKQLLAQIKRIYTDSGLSQYVPLEQAHHLILAENVISPMSVPPHDNAAMDGYALAQRSQFYNPLEYIVVETVLAGDVPQKALEPGQCARIMTGAMLPPNTDSVVMQELVEGTGDMIRLESFPRQGSNIRRCGEDIASGAPVFVKGHQLSSVDIGLLASLGIAQVNVVEPIKVALFATGDEFQAVGRPLAEGQIYDTNSHVLCSALKALGCEVMNYGIVEDDLHVIKEMLSEANRHCDVIITSGGVSVGDADFVKTALAELGEVDFWKVAMKPGKPFAFGHLSNSVFFGLPGNPVSAVITFQQLVIPALEMMQGKTPTELPSFWAIAKERIRKRAGRKDFQRGYYEVHKNGHLHVSALKGQGSGILSGISRANCLLLLESDREDIMPGEQVQISLFHPAVQG